MPNQYSQGMLGNLFNQGMNARRTEELDDDKSLERLSAMDGFQADRLATYQGADMAGKGIGELAAAAAGKDPRTPAVRNAQAIEAAKAQVSQLGFDPQDPKSMNEFYKKVIAILQQQGLVPEAMAVAQEWRTQSLADTKASAEQQKLDLQNKELERKRDRDANDYDVGLARVEALKAKVGAAASPIAKMMADLERTEDPVMRAHLKRAIENASASKIIVQDLGGQIQLLDATTREPIRIDDKTPTPRDQAKTDKADENEQYAYAEIKADMQRQVDKSAELHNHAGLAGMSGRLGQFVGKEGTMGTLASVFAGDKTRGAYALYTSIVGGTLLTGLTKLKQASKTGASGLGALSEREGEKVQADAAALGQAQNADDMKLRLRQYIQTITEGGQRLDGKAQASGINVIPLRVPQLNSKGGNAQNATRSQPAPAPASAPAAGAIPNASAKPAEEWVRVNGKLQRAR